MKSKRNIKLVIEYDGTDYQGWQVQPNGPTVQEEVEKAIAKITGDKLRIFGAGRTDAGVHALGQVANFFTSSGLTAKKFRDALNGVLPPDIAILNVEEVGDSFHARYSAKSKLYRYGILNREVCSPLERNYSLFYPYSLDLEAMREAAQKFVGTHDFSSFGCNAGREDDPMRTILGIEIGKKDDHIIIEIEAVSFLYKMARSVVGTLIDVGNGRLRPADVVDILGARDRGRASATAPAHGLYLVKVKY